MSVLELVGVSLHRNGGGLSEQACTVEEKHLPYPMENNMPARVDPLLVAVKRLTTTHMEGVPVDGERRTYYATHAPLFRQLREAIAGDIGGTGGSSKSHAERTPIDPDAFVKYMDIVDDVRRFHRTWVGTSPDVHELPETSLARAYLAIRNAAQQGQVTEEKQKALAARWKRVGDVILEKLSPPTVYELSEYPCPSCGFSRYIKITGRGGSAGDRKRWVEKEQRVALTVIYKPDNLGGLTMSVARCGCCDEGEWAGVTAIRSLSVLLEQIDQRARALHANTLNLPPDSPAAEHIWLFGDVKPPANAPTFEYPLPVREQWRIVAHEQLEAERLAEATDE